MFAATRPAASVLTGFIARGALVVRTPRSRSVLLGPATRSNTGPLPEPRPCFARAPGTQLEQPILDIADGGDGGFVERDDVTMNRSEHP
jgi:hypothetical protein